MYTLKKQFYLFLTLLLGLVVSCRDLDELNILTEHLRPEGVWMGVHVNTVAESDAVLDQMARWAAHKR